MDAQKEIKSRRIRVFIVEDQKSVRDALRILLKYTDDFEVVGEAGDGKEAIERISGTEVDIAMVDITMPVMNGFDAIQHLRALKPALRILVLTADPNAEEESLKVGANGFLSKTEIPRLIETLRMLARGKVYYDSKVLAPILALLKRTPASLETLSLREREVLSLIADGLGSQDIANRLCLSVRTIETHRRRLMEALNIHGVVGLTKYAIRAGLTEP